MFHEPRPIVVCFWLGFKLDTLLRLADVKATDKKTSLLAFVTRALLTRGGSSVGSLPRQLAAVPPAAVLQVRGTPSCICPHHQSPRVTPTAVLQVVVCTLPER